MKTMIKLVISDCSECPKVVEKRTPNAGYAHDYFCSITFNRKVMGYVEWESDKAPVPDWCPIKA